MSNPSSLFSVGDGQRNRHPLIGAGSKGAPLVVRKTAERLFSRKTLLLSSAVASALMCPTAALASFEYVTHWTRFDTSGANALFNGPTDVALLKSNGNMAVVDSNAGVTGGGEVVIQQTDGTYVTKVAALTDQGPVRAFTDTNTGDVYISTYYEAKIRHYTEAGGALTLADTWTGCTANGGNGPYNWGKTFGVATDSTGAIYVNDYDNLRIIKMNSGGRCLAAPLTTYTKNGAPGQVFLNLTGLAVDSSDNLWVADYGKKVLVKYDSAGTWLTTLTGFSNCGTTAAFSSPKDIDIDLTTNEMFITEGGGANSGVIKLDSSGNFLTKATKYNTSTTFSSPFGSGFAGGKLYATDYGHNAVVKYTNPTRKVSVTASAGGTVAADVGGVITGTTGGNTCTDQFVDNTTVVLTATPTGSNNVTWGGADGVGCTGNTCTLSNIAANKDVTATFAPPNTAPSASSVAISGTAQVGIQLTGSYTYGDPEFDPQDTSGTGTSYRYVRSTDNSVATTGDNADAATGTTGGNNVTYAVANADVGKYLFYCVTPKATSGTLIGTEVCSSATAQVPTPVDGFCGSDNLQTLTNPPTNTCSAGTASTVISGTTDYNWTCDGTNGSTVNASCFATRNYIVTTSVSGGNGTVSANQTVAYNATPSFTLTPNASYTSGPVTGTCGGSLTGNSYTTNAVTASCTVVASFSGQTSYTAASATGTGNITASFTTPDGGLGCGYTVKRFIAVSGGAGSPPVGTAPAGVAFPQGLFDFVASGCNVGSTLNFTITYPQVLPVGTVYWKYGPTPGNATPHWYVLPAVIAGNTATFSIQDGGLGDDGPADGSIVDQGGPGFGGGAAAIPTLSEWALLALAGLLGMFAMGVVRRRAARTI